MRRSIGVLFLVAAILLSSACGSHPDLSSKKNKEQSQALSQTVEHNDYSVKLPKSWKVTRDSEDSNPTLYFEIEQKEAGGLFLARYDKLQELPADRKEISDLRTSSHQVYQYETKYETA